MEPVYSRLTILAAAVAQDGKIKEAADIMAEATGANKDKQPDVAHLFVQYMERKMHINAFKDEAFLENMFQEMLTTILKIL